MSTSATTQTLPREELGRRWLDVDHKPTDPPAIPTPTWYVCTFGVEMIYTEHEDLPGWRSVDLRRYPIGTRLLDNQGVLHEVRQEHGYRQKQWRPLLRLLPMGWAWSPTSVWTNTAVATRQHDENVLVLPAQLFVALAQYWTDESVPLRERREDHQDFFDELTLQLHRPAPTRRAVMKVVKHPTQRGRATATNSDPMTPWALRMASERLVGDVTDDRGHQTDDVSLKRLLNLTTAHEQLQTQLDEVAGHLQAAKTLLLQQDRSNERSTDLSAREGQS